MGDMGSLFVKCKDTNDNVLLFNIKIISKMLLKKTQIFMSADLL